MSDRIYQLRIYTRDDRDGWEKFQKVWKNHILSLGKYQINTHGVFVPLDDPDTTEVWALCSYPSLKDAARLEQEYIDSDDCFNDFHEYPEIKGKGTYRSYNLKPLDCSPLGAY